MTVVVLMIGESSGKVSSSPPVGDRDGHRVGRGLLLGVGVGALDVETGPAARRNLASWTTVPAVTGVPSPQSIVATMSFAVAERVGVDERRDVDVGQRRALGAVDRDRRCRSAVRRDVDRAADRDRGGAGRVVSDQDGDREDALLRVRWPPCTPKLPPPRATTVPAWTACRRPSRSSR